MTRARKLPVLQTVAAAYGYVFGHVSQAARLCSGWFAIAAALLALSAVLVARMTQTTAVDFSNRPPMTPQLQASAMLALPFLVIALASPAIVVAWHRVIIRDAPVRRLPAPIGAAILYLVRTTLIGVIWPAVLGIVGLLPIVYLRKLDIDPTLKFAIELGLVGFGAALGLLISARLLLILPAGAVGDWSVNFGRSWRLTAGNSWRLLLGFVLAAAPLLVVNAATNLAFSAFEDAAIGSGALILIAAVSVVLALATAILEASFLSFAYLFFVNERQQTAS